MTDAVDTPESLWSIIENLSHLNIHEVDVAVDALTCYAALLEQVAAHNQRCAGEWVPVGERLPEGGWVGNVLAITPTASVLHEKVQRSTFGTWCGHNFGSGEPTHWRDARLPGGEG